MIHEWLHGAHVEERHGKQSDAIKNCTKEDNPFTKIEHPSA